MQSELWEILVQLVDSIDPKDAQVFGMRIDDITFSLPVEFGIVPTEVGFRIVTNLPQTRWQEGITPSIGRMFVTLHEQEVTLDDEL